MGLLDAAISAVSGKLGNQLGGANPSAIESIMALLGNAQNGGLDSLVQNFKDKGLGDVIASWISTGKNLPVSPDQIQSALGTEQVEQFAQRAGVAPQSAAATLAELLPGVIDKLTPDGNIPAGGLLAQGLNLLKSQLSAHP